VAQPCVSSLDFSRRRLLEPLGSAFVGFEFGHKNLGD
jgi:hypothetical protein